MNEIIIYFLLGGVLFSIVLLIMFYIIQRIKNLFKKSQKIERPHSFKCLDGHIVRSKAELIIDNHLYRLNLEHEYEKTISVKGKKIKYDWYLPKFGVYIEYWGFYGKKYMDRKEEKIKLYKKGKLTLISIEDIMLTDIYSILEKELKNYVRLDAKANPVYKHCPNCGTSLDERFKTFLIH